MSEPLVSVCIGTFNRARYLRECLDSVFAQTYRNFEVIVADNASTDETVAIARSYGERVKLICRPANSGMCSTTRNEAVRQARGDYVAFLDSDDAWLPDKLARQVRFLEDHLAIPLCHAYCRVMDADSCELGVRHEGRIPPTGPYFEALLDHCWITISSVLMRRSLYAECGPFSEILPYGRSGEDWEFFLKAARRHEIGFLPEVLARYRKAGAGTSGGDWRGVPDAFPFLLCLRRRRDLWEGLVPAARLDAIVRRSALASSQYWRDRGCGGRAAYFPAQWLVRRPLCGPAWAELAKCVFRALMPHREGISR